MRVGRRTVTIADGKTIAGTIKLNRTGRRLRVRFKRLPVLLTITLTVNGQRSTVASRKLTGKPPHRRAHRRARKRIAHPLAPGDLRPLLSGVL